MGLRGILLQQQLPLAAIILAAIAAATAASEPNSSCIRRCGSLQIPYPFGTSEECCLDRSFLITCNNSTPFLGGSNELKVLDVSMDGEMRVSSQIARDCPNEPGNNASESAYGFSLLDHFLISPTKNKFTAVGCNTVAVIVGIIVGDENYTTGCLSLCNSIESVGNGSCDGIGCCQISIPQGMSLFGLAVSSWYNDSTVADFNPCSFGFVSEDEAYNFSSLDLMNLQNRETVPVVLDWTVGNETCTDAKTNLTSYGCKANQSECYNSINGPGYFCNCSSGFEGNPYLHDGCQDINECEISKPCNMTCTNIPGSYKCGCSKGYEGDGMKHGTGCRPIVSNSRRIAIELEYHL
ncbi:wall-associated receptor kinase 2-like [Corylus avellana]|uniref:wall-associated receptor kinase 2-like n=1 Tax=Corylus avellana TaxID=13451 RepID=UPI00286C0155|nr:wall-associated receptor kinase 2-like [Corylus avellana]